MSLQSSGKDLKSVVFDQQGMESLPGLKCVVMGRDREPGLGQKKKFYSLVIKPSSSHREDVSFKRVGAGYMKEHQIVFGGTASTVQIR